MEDASIAKPRGYFTVAEVAAPPSPVEEAVPVPAIVLITPVEAVILRILWPAFSAIYKLPEASNTIPAGLFNVAEVAAEPSPVLLAVPVPAIVLITPVEVVILRIRLPPFSDIYKLPDPSNARSVGKFNVAEVAAEPSPVLLPVPVPAIVLMTPVEAVILRIRLPVASAMYKFPEPSTAMPLGLFNVAEVAAEPSPVLPAEPVPAKVVMTPDVFTLRI